MSTTPKHVDHVSGGQGLLSTRQHGRGCRIGMCACLRQGQRAFLRAPTVMWASRTSQSRQCRASCRMESRVTPGRMVPSRGGVISCCPLPSSCSEESALITSSITSHGTSIHGFLGRLRPLAQGRACLSEYGYHTAIQNSTRGVQTELATGHVGEDWPGPEVDTIALVQACVQDVLGGVCTPWPQQRTHSWPQTRR